MKASFLEKVAAVLDSTADYIESIEQEEMKQQETKVQAEKEAKEKEKEELITPILDKLSSKEDEDVELLKTASPELLRFVTKNLNKTTPTTENWGEVENNTKKAGVKLDPLAEFALS